MGKEIGYLFLKLSCYLLFQKPIRIFYCLEHIFAVTLELTLWSLSEAHWTIANNVLRVSYMFYYLFWKTWVYTCWNSKILIFLEESFKFCYSRWHSKIL